MKYRIRFAKKKFLTQLYLGNIIVAISIMICMGIFTLSSSKNYIYDNFTMSNEAQIKQTATQVDDYFLQALNLIDALDMQNVQMRKVVELAQEEDLINFYYEFSAFKTTYLYHDWIDSVWVYYGGNYVINSRNGLSRNAFFQDKAYLGQLLDEFSGKEFEYYFSNTTYITDAYSQVISIAAPLYLSDDINDKGYVIVNVKIPVIMRKAYQNAETLDSFSIMSDTERVLISYSGDELSARTLNRLEDWSGTAKVEGRDYDLYSISSKVVPFYTYVLASSHYNMNEHINSMLEKFLLIVFILVVVEIVISYWISQYIYTPLKQLINNVDLMILGVKPAREKTEENELEFLYDYMLRMQTEILDKQAVVEAYMPMVRKNLGTMMLDGYFKDETELFSELRKHEIEMEGGAYCLCMFMLDNWLSLQEEYGEEEKNALKTLVFGTIEEEMDKSTISIPAIPQKGRMVFIVCVEENIEESLEKVFGIINEKLSKTASVSISMACSSVFYNIRETKKYYEELQKRGLQRFNLGKGCCINAIYENLEEEQIQILQKNQMILFANAVHRADREEAGHVLDYFLEELRRASINNVQTAVKQLLVDLSGYYKAAKAMEDIRSELPELIQYSTMEELKERINGAVDEIFSDSSDKSRDMMNRVKQYIDDNYQVDISLMILADRFKLSPSYLSTMFKKAHGIGIVDYTNKLRIDKAMGFLRDSDMSIQEIAEKTGFSNYNSFSRVFKKVAGMSAKDFRRG